MSGLLSTAANVMALLDRHQERRARNVPTVSVFAGSETLARPPWQPWADQAKRNVFVVPETRVDSLIAAWINEITHQFDLTGAASSWLSSRHPGQASSSFPPA
jgi:hypothetical protein